MNRILAALILACAIGGCDPPSFVLLAEPNRGDVARISAEDAIGYLTQASSQRAFPIHSSDGTIDVCEYSQTSMRSRDGRWQPFSIWTYWQFNGNDVLEGRTLFAILIVNDDVGVDATNVCVAYARSAPSLNQDLKQEIVDVSTALERLGLSNRQFRK